MLFQWPSREAERILQRLLCFPIDLPDLNAKRPPAGNSRSAGIETSYFEQRKRGELPTGLLIYRLYLFHPWVDPVPSPRPYPLDQIFRQSSQPLQMIFKLERLGSGIVTHVRVGALAT
jgi:hypothetical protein